MLKAPPPAREPLERISVGESLARTAQKFGEFQEQGGLAGLVGMEPAATRLARSSRLMRQRLDAGEPIQADPEAMDLALNFSPASLTGMIRAFHGTPHKFGKFDVSRIGTGEGAQAYGHGLYFAGNKGTAKTYRDALGGRVPIADRRKLDDAWVNAARNMRDQGFSENEMRKALKSAYPDAPDKQLSDAVAASDPGNLYTVDIDMHADELLDWDKPLSQQSEEVRKALTPLFRGLFEKRNKPLIEGILPEARRQMQNLNQMTGQQAYETLAETVGAKNQRRASFRTPGFRDLPPHNDKEAASEALRKAGIKGIRYLDQGSRGAGEGTHNFVVFDDSILKIVNE